MATLLTVHLPSSAVSGTIGESASALGSIASVADSGIKGADQPVVEAIGIISDMIQQLVQMYLEPMNPNPATMSPRDARREAAKDLMTYAKSGPVDGCQRPHHRDHGRAARDTRRPGYQGVQQR